MSVADWLQPQWLAVRGVALSGRTLSAVLAKVAEPFIRSPSDCAKSCGQTAKERPRSQATLLAAESAGHTLVVQLASAFSSAADPVRVTA